MAGVVTIPSGTRTKLGSWRSIETLTASTSTTPQAVSIETDVTVLGGSTVTAGGAVANLYTMADGVQGQEKLIMHATATGASHVIFDYATGRMPIFDGLHLAATTVGTGWVSGTGQFVLQADGDFVLVRFIGSEWQIMDMRGATMDNTT